jgi:hypothetical protein
MSSQNNKITELKNIINQQKELILKLCLSSKTSENSTELNQAKITLKKAEEELKLHLNSKKDLDKKLKN